MRNPKESTLFVAAFCIDNFTTRADILKRKDDGSWHMIEVKSSVNGKQKFIDDMAYTAMIIERAGFNIAMVSLLLISKAFRLGMSSEKLFVEIDHTDTVKARIEKFKPVCAELETVSWPAYCLDFETVMTAIPLFPDIAPYTQLPTQYSILSKQSSERIITFLILMAAHQ